MGIQAFDTLFWVWQGAGSPTWDSWSYFAKATRVMGERDEVPNTDKSECSLDEQRLSMVLELYYRNAGGKREGRKERGGKTREK